MIDASTRKIDPTEDDEVRSLAVHNRRAKVHEESD
jgi:hypothetical protein